MAGFVQIIEFQTSRIDEIRALVEKFRSDRAAEGDGSTAPVRGTFTQDRDQPDHYLNVVEFPSYDAAMANSNRPETGEFAAKLAELCDAPPTFRNLDVVEAWEL
jgi:quinol monooxygenase YgiN